MLYKYGKCARIFFFGGGRVGGVFIVKYSVLVFYMLWAFSVKRLFHSRLLDIR